MASPAINPPPMAGIAPAMGNMSDVPVSGASTSGSSAGGAKMAFRVVEGLKSIASAYPNVSGEVDEIISMVEKLTLSLMSQGSPGQAAPFATQGGTGESAPF
jgi:hypothetical protein